MPQKRRLVPGNFQWAIGNSLADSNNDFIKRSITGRQPIALGK